MAVITTAEREGDGMETELSQIVTDQPNKRMVNNNVKSIMNKCIVLPTTKGGKCNNKICNIYIGSFSKEYNILCKSCKQIQLSLQHKV